MYWSRVCRATGGAGEPEGLRRLGKVGFVRVRTSHELAGSHCGSPRTSPREISPRRRAPASAWDTPAAAAGTATHRYNLARFFIFLFLRALSPWVRPCRPRGIRGVWVTEAPCPARIGLVTRAQRGVLRFTAPIA